MREATLVKETCCRRVGHGLAQIGPDGRLQYEYMLKDNQTYTELVVVDPNESCAPTPVHMKQHRAQRYRVQCTLLVAVLQASGARF